MVYNVINMVEQKKIRGLKHNSKAVLDKIIAQKDKNYSKAYREVHPNAGVATAQAMASKLVAKPSAQIYMAEHVNKAKQTIVQLMDSEKDDIRLRSSTEILDREYGRSTTRTEVTTQGITLNIDLMSSLDDVNVIDV